MAENKIDKLANLFDKLNDKSYQPSLIYYHRSLAMLSILPYKKQKENFYKRVNGNYSITVISNPDYGLPYGSYPRLIFLFLYSYCHQHKTRIIPLGNSLYDFTKKLGVVPSSVSYKMIRGQCLALFNSTISLSEKTQECDKVANFIVGEKTQLFWHRHKKNTYDLFDSSVHISQGLYDEFQLMPIPALNDIVKEIKNSAFQLDLYFFLNLRIYALNNNKKYNKVFITNEQLINQFGADYATVKDFKKQLKKHLNTIGLLWHKLDYELTKNGLLIYPSPLLINPK